MLLVMVWAGPRVGPGMLAIVYHTLGSREWWDVVWCVVQLCYNTVWYMYMVVVNGGGVK